MKEKIKNKIEELKDKIRIYNRRYYTLNAPSISDHEYDQLMRELITLEEKYPELKTLDSPTQRVGGEPLDTFNEVVHETKMLSLSNAFSKEELIDFENRCKKSI